MPFFIVGAGPVGRETLDVALARELPVEAFVDDEKAGTTVRGLRVLRPDEVAAGDYLVAIAAPAPRERLGALLSGRGLSARTLVHPRSVIAPETTLGAGTLVLAQAHISSSVVIGEHCQVHYNATVGHDTHLGDRVTVYPGANVSGWVHIEEDVTIGSNAVILPSLRVGAGAFVGAGAVVTRDVESGLVVVGAPARPHRSAMS